MTIQSLHTLYAVNLVRGAGDLLIDQMTGNDYDPQLEELLQRSDGSIDTNFAADGTRKPKLGGTCTKVKTLLDNVGIDGCFFGLGQTFTAAEFYMQKRLKGGAFTSGAAHKKLAAGGGMISFASIEATGDSSKPAAATLEFNLTSADGATSPLAVTANATLPGNPTFDECYVAAGMKIVIGGTTIFVHDVIGTSINLNPDLIIGPFVSGEVFPTYAGLRGRRLGITTRSYDMSLIESGKLGLGSQSGTVTQYLKKVLNGGGRVADNVGEHISFTSAGRISVGQISASDTEDYVAQISVTPVKSGGNAVISWNTATTIVMS